MRSKFATLTLALLMTFCALGNGTQTDSLTVSTASMREAVKIFYQRDYYQDMYNANRVLNAACEAECKHLRKQRWLYGGCGVAAGLLVGVIAFR